MFLPLLLLAVSALFSSSFSAAAAAAPHEHTSDLFHSEPRSLPSRWYHDERHPAHDLFRRQSVASDGIQYATVGSPTWSAAYPAGTPDVSALPAPWVNALNAAVSAGKIPNIPVPSMVNSSPAYPQGTNPTDPTICSAYYKCRVPADIWDAPNGSIGIGFDDGPYMGSAMLYDFLKQNNQHATHFMIGLNILSYPQLFTRAFEELEDDIAVHTWTHPHMSTLSNLNVLAELGWSMEIIHNSTGGRLPRYWRPPYGDADNRVRAIAQEVFGLTAILWNQDTADWSLTVNGGTNLGAINASMTQWLTGSKSPGLIILEHELSNLSVQAFQAAYPLMISQGWTLPSVATINGTGTYLNSVNATSPVKVVNGVLSSDVYASTSSTSSSTSGATSGSGSSTSASKPANTSSSQSSPSSASANGSPHHFVSPLAAILCLMVVVFT